MKLHVGRGVEGEVISHMFHLHGVLLGLPLDSSRTPEGLPLPRACRQRCVLSLSSDKCHITLNLSLWSCISSQGNIKVNNNWIYTNVADFHIFYPFILLLS